MDGPSTPGRRGWLVLLVLLAFSTGGCSLLATLGLGPSSSPAPLPPLGPDGPGGRVEVAASGFAITVPADWTVQVAASAPDLASAPDMIAWEALRATSPGQHQGCSVTVALPEAGLLDSGNDTIGSSEAWAVPELSAVDGVPELRIPGPRVAAGSGIRVATLTSWQRRASEDPGTPRDVLYAMVCAADAQLDQEPLLESFEMLPIVASGSPAP
jgi:hypothetical protein